MGSSPASAQMQGFEIWGGKYDESLEALGILFMMEKKPSRKDDVVREEFDAFLQDKDPEVVAALNDMREDVFALPRGVTVICADYRVSLGDAGGAIGWRTKLPSSKVRTKINVLSRFLKKHGFEGLPVKGIYSFIL